MVLWTPLTLQPADPSAQISLRGLDQQMVVIWHQAIPMNPQSMLFDHLPQRGQKLPPIHIVPKGPPSFIAPGGNVIDRATKLNSKQAVPSQLG